MGRSLESHTALVAVLGNPGRNCYREPGSPLLMELSFSGERRFSVNAIRATWQNGQIVPDGPVDWTDGVRLRVEPGAPPTGTTGDEWSNTPEAVAEWLKWYDALEPLVMTPAEEAEADAWLRKMSDYSAARVGKDAEDLFP